MENNFNKYDFSVLENHLKQEIESKRISGSSIIIYKDNEILLDGHYGFSNIETQTKINSKTRFRIASMTKPITAVATMIAIEKGLFNLDDYVYKYIEEVKDKPICDLNMNVIDKGPYNFTIRQVLNHSAGFGCGEYEGVCFNNCCSDENTKTLESFISSTKKMGLQFVPGTHFNYSGSIAYNLVARIIEITSGMKYEEFLKKFIFEPLEMKDTSYIYNENDDKAISYISLDGKLIYYDEKGRGFDSYYPGFNSGGAGLISTKNDYFNFSLMLLNKGSYKGMQIIKEESFEEMLKYKPTPNYNSGGMETFGISFFVRDKDYSSWQKLPSGCFGWSGAYGTYFFVDPKDNIILVYMHNSSTYGGAGAPQHNIIDEDICDIFHL